MKQTFTENKAARGRTLQNNLADWLLYQPRHANACAAVILEMSANESADIRWREFCVQKLALVLEKPVIRVDLADQCMSALIEKAGDPRICFSGTALLGLYRLSKKPEPLVEPEKVMQLAEHVLSVADFPTANKVTALQVAGLSGSKAALSLARKYVGGDSYPIQLRVSAIALLGNRGNANDLPELNLLTRSVDYRLRKAAQLAVQKLTS